MNDRTPNKKILHKAASKPNAHILPKPKQSKSEKDLEIKQQITVETTINNNDQE